MRTLYNVTTANNENQLYVYIHVYMQKQFTGDVFSTHATRTTGCP